MAAARKLSAAPEDAAPKRPSILELVNQGLVGVDVEGFVQAAKKYGDDHEQALADLKAGHHPLQRKRALRAVARDGAASGLEPPRSAMLAPRAR